MTEPPQSPDDDVEDYVGLERGEAERRARSRGWSVRSVDPGAVVTAEYVFRRINFVIVDGVVSRVWKG